MNIKVKIPVTIDQGFSQQKEGFISRRGLVERPSPMRDEHNRCWCFRVPFDLSQDAGPRGFYFISRELTEWLEERKVDFDHCRLRYVPGGEHWVLSVPDDIALLFKLTWGR